MGNKLNSVIDRATGKPIDNPKLWLKHVIIDNHAFYKKLFVKLTPQMQDTVIKATQGYEVMWMTKQGRWQWIRCMEPEVQARVIEKAMKAVANIEVVEKEGAEGPE